MPLTVIVEFQEQLLQLVWWLGAARRGAARRGAAFLGIC